VESKERFPHSHSLHGCGILQRQTKNDVYTKDWTLPGSPGLDLAGSSNPATILANMPACAADTHSGFDADLVRHQMHAQIIQAVDAETGFPHGPSGGPTYVNWPAAQSIEHQAMYITEIRRAYEGGLRLLFASTTDNQLLSDLWHIGTNVAGNPIPTPDPNFDFNAAIRQITFIQQLVAANSSWMQIVTTSAEARQAISNNKLAVVVSLEMDSLTPDQILNLIQNYQVRHVIPIHLSNNTMGGTAVYDNTFNTNTYFLTGAFFSIHTTPCVNFMLGVPSYLDHGPAGAIVPKPLDPSMLNVLGYATPPSAGGHENLLGLNKQQFTRLMRTGVLLDIVHMDEQSAADALSLGEQYQFPLMDSHTGLRDDSNCSGGIPSSTSERAIPYSHVKRLAALGGVLGLGTSANTGPDPVELWLQNYKEARSLMGGKGVALGTDFNGLSPQIVANQYNLPTYYPIDIGLRLNPPQSITVNTLQRFQLVSRTFDFTTDGIANYGLLPDFLQAVSQHPAPSWNPSEGTSPTPNPDAMPELGALFHSAEDVIEMWQKAENAAGSIPPP
jgi:microsomal dipeptidase-like Zn-dependent dipeptidase